MYVIALPFGYTSRLGKYINIRATTYLLHRKAVLCETNHIMSTENPNYNVGGTAKDGGLSTADTVADGDVDGGNRASDGAYEPHVGGKAAPKETRSKTGGIAEKAQETATQVKEKFSNYGMEEGEEEEEGSRKTGEAHVGNKNYGVGGTSKDGGLSTADTVADGGPDDAEEDEDFKP
ncbi:hypothetical protein AC579_757 [Pseudocercospora musae]|uniref:Uncharacterized protein n=1 Tax=Pseudocercospora musae TaxID=113226 RepID=A0A139IJH5_9PEZI|nr:hypothetical protein AC579_757 [Pseudocercospora musae]KXT14891.1 hypothetical protein AC579_757 [Pseudocercospora musae]